MTVDWRSSPTLSAIREVAGEPAALRLVAARGGTHIYLPEQVTPNCQLALIVGVDAARRIVDHMGGHRSIDVPTGRGLRHGRRIDHVEVRRPCRRLDRLQHRAAHGVHDAPGPQYPGQGA